MSDNPLQSFGCSEFERGLRNLPSVLEAIQIHRKHLKRFWWTILGVVGSLAFVILLSLVFYIIPAKRLQFPLIIVLFTSATMLIHISRLEAGLKVLLLRKVMLEEDARQNAAGNRMETSPD